MKLSSRLALCAFFCLIGIVIGIWFDAFYHPNYMMVWVSPTHKIDLAAQQYDVVQWKNIDSDNHSTVAPIQFTFSGPKQVPCLTKNNFNPKDGYCLVYYPYPDGTYPYACDPSGKLPCDPNTGPSSGPGGGIGMDGAAKAANTNSRPNSLMILGTGLYFKALVSNFGASFSHAAPPVVESGVAGAPANASGTVGCNGTVVVVAPGNPDPKYPNEITVSPQGTITWSSLYGPGGFVLSGLDSLCSNSPVKTSCTLNASVNGKQAYGVRVTASEDCAQKNPTTAYFEVTN
jgi:hypothetical protein